MTSFKHVWLALPAVLCAWMFAGCTGSGVLSNPQEMTVKREINLDGRTVVVVPCREGDGQYFGSFAGRELSERLANEMRNHMPTTRLAGAVPLESIPSGPMTEAQMLSDLAAAAKADVVVTGHITEMRTQEPKTRLILRGTCSVDVTVYDVKTARNIKTWSVTVHYPDRGEGIPETDTTPTEVQSRVLQQTADVIAKRFYTYKKSLGPQQVEW